MACWCYVIVRCRSRLRSWKVEEGTGNRKAEVHRLGEQRGGRVRNFMPCISELHLFEQCVCRARSRLLVQNCFVLACRRSIVYEIWTATLCRHGPTLTSQSLRHLRSLWGDTQTFSQSNLLSIGVRSTVPCTVHALALHMFLSIVERRADIPGKER